MRTGFFILFLGLSATVLGGAPKATFTENKGQWPGQVLYRALIPGGALFVERSAFTYVLYSGGPLRTHGHVHHPGEVEDEGKAHAYRVHFEGGQAQGSVGSVRQPQFENFFIGADDSHWGTGCGVFGEVLLKNVWPGIDLRLDGTNGLKYDLIVALGANPDLIRLRYEGQDGIQLVDGELRISTTAGGIVEDAPRSWVNLLSGIDNIREPVPSAYRLNGNTVSFDVIATTAGPLTIDPTLTFASYSGSTADNFGYTATYDDEGHLYGGGIVFQTGYPVTLGVLQGFWAGGNIDVGISKWSSDGSTLIWSTYLGGSGNESPHSMVVNSSHELYVMGSTGSGDFPTTGAALDGTFNGGPALAGWTNISGGYGFTHASGCDIYVSHFNVDATALVGSTYVGGNDNDGLNSSVLLTHNYGDHFRGEIALDPAENPVVATTTRSGNVPISPGAPQPVFGGGVQDGYCFRLNPALSTLLWGTFLGGSGDDNALGVQFDSGGQVFVSGGTTSVNLPMAGTPFQSTFSGAADGYVMRYSAAGNALLSSTYLGTPAYDQSYFVQLNTADEVFVVGQTHGNYPMTPGKYGTVNSAQFIHKFDHALGASIWSTRIGNGNVTGDISPTAFLVSDCGQIYFSGWAGSTNANAGNTNSTTVGLAVTPDAFQPSTNGSDVYLMVLEAEASALNYATYFGGGSSSEHVDGGTSRFDKNGTVYHAVCAGCGSQDDFPTTPGAWSNTNNSFNCNLGVFKFDLGQAHAVIGISGPSIICFPASAQFTNTSIGGTNYLWDFGDNTPTSTEQSPSHTYTTEGEFTVTMILTDSATCVQADTATIVITTLPPPMAIADPVPAICPGGSIQLQASGGDSYTWSPSTGLDAANIADPTATPEASTVYSVVVTGTCGTDTATVDVDLIDTQAFAFPDTSACIGASVPIGATGGGTYAWTPPETLSDPTLAIPLATPLDTTMYTVVINTPEGCIVTDSILVNVFAGPPQTGLVDTTICAGTSVQLHAPDALQFTWQAANGITTLDIQDPVVTPSTPTTYTVQLTNACGSVFDDVFVDLILVQASAWPDTLVCPGQPVQLYAIGGINYAWSPTQGLSDPDSSETTAIAPTSMTYSVIVSDINGCRDTAEARIDLYPYPTVYAGRDVVIDWREEVQLNATGSGDLSWTPPDGLDCTTCPSPIASPEESTAYIVMVTDSNGCTATDEVLVILNGSLYVPNTFSPNGDGYNDGFGAWGTEVAEFRMYVFNRWGEEIFTTDKLDGRWNGTYHGVDSPIDTYVWKVEATEISGRKRNAVGHVNLVR